MTATPADRHTPDGDRIVEVDGSMFLLEWLDLDVLAAAAASHPAGRPSRESARERAA